MQQEMPANVQERSPQGTTPDSLTRLQVREVFCPECEALPGEKCEGKRGERERNHMSRVRKAKAMLQAGAR